MPLSVFVRQRVIGKQVEILYDLVTVSKEPMIQLELGRQPWVLIYE